MNQLDELIKNYEQFCITKGEFESNLLRINFEEKLNSLEKDIIKHDLITGQEKLGELKNKVLAISYGEISDILELNNIKVADEPDGYVLYQLKELKENLGL